MLSATNEYGSLDHFISEDRFQAIATIHNMVNPTSEFYSWDAGHKVSAYNYGTSKYGQYDNNWIDPFIGALGIQRL